jgi:hypothetical protein
LFNELVNFELNNQDFSPGISFGNLRIDETTGLRDYAEDLNKIKEALLRLSNSWMSRLKNGLKFLLAQKRKTELFR